MASLVSTHFILQLVFVISLFHVSFASRKLTELVQDQTNLLQYHHGPLLSGKISINLIWYSKFNPTQRAVISDFVTSLCFSPPQTQPLVATWWKTTQNYYHLANSKKPSSLSLSLGKQILDENYSLRKSLTEKQIKQLASKADQIHTVNVVLTASDVTVDGFCMSRCGAHGCANTSQIKGRNYKFPYIWVGNSVTQCPGQCAWPFHQPMYEPQTPPLVAPNNDVGLDGMLINLASLLAGTVTNPSSTVKG